MRGCGCRFSLFVVRQQPQAGLLGHVGKAQVQGTGRQRIRVRSGGHGNRVGDLMVYAPWRIHLLPSWSLATEDLVCTPALQSQVICRLPLVSVRQELAPREQG